MVRSLGGHSNCLDYYFFKMIVFHRSYEQLSHKNEEVILFYIQYNKIKHFQHRMRKKRQMISVEKKKIIKTEQNIALFTTFVCFGLKKKRLGTVLRCVSSSNSVQPFPPPCFVQESILVTSKKKMVHVHSVSTFCVFFFTIKDTSYMT